LRASWSGSQDLGRRERPRRTLSCGKAGPSHDFAPSRVTDRRASANCLLAIGSRPTKCGVIAGVAKLVDARHSKCRDFGHVGSIPTARTSHSDVLHPDLAGSSQASLREAESVKMSEFRTPNKAAPHLVQRQLRPSSSHSTIRTRAERRSHSGARASAAAFKRVSNAITAAITSANAGASPKIMPLMAT
jgi:hypothetical protein